MVLWVGHPSLPVLQTGLSLAWTGAWEVPPQPPGVRQAVPGGLAPESYCSQGGQSPGLLNTHRLGLCAG